MFPFRRATSGNATRRTVTVYGPHPLSVAMAGQLATLHGGAVQGRSGAVRIGLSGGAGNSYRGDLGPLQSFRGWVKPGDVTNVRGSSRTGLPNTQPPATEGLTVTQRALAGL